MSIYKKLGVRPVINCWGVATELGGWTPTENVIRAMEEANTNQVEMQELLRKSGDFIADLLGVESAFITSGGAAAQALSTAALMAGKDPDKIAQLPDTTGMKNEVVIQKKNRYMFDRCFTLCGAKLVEAGDEDGCTEDQLISAIGSRTTALAYWIQPPNDNSIVPLNRVAELGRSIGIPTIADACSQIYPLEYFRENAQSADLVTFGAKYMGAPHSAGFVCGRSDLIEAVSAQSFVSFHYDGGRAVGRAMKIDRHEVVGVVQAIEDWFSMDHEERLLEYDSRFSTIINAVSDIRGVSTKRVEIPHYVPYMLHVSLDINRVGKDAPQIKTELDNGDPRIWLGARTDDTLEIVVNTLNDGEDRIVGDRLRQVLTRDSQVTLEQENPGESTNNRGRKWREPQ